MDDLWSERSEGEEGSEEECDSEGVDEGERECDSSLIPLCQTWAAFLALRYSIESLRPLSLPRVNIGTTAEAYNSILCIRQGRVRIAPRLD